MSLINLIEPCIKLLIDIANKNKYIYTYMQGAAVTAPYIEGRAPI